MADQDNRMSDIRRERFYEDGVLVPSRLWAALEQAERDREGAYQQLQGAVSADKSEAYRLRTIMAEAAKQDPATCRKWIRDALEAMPPASTTTEDSGRRSSTNERLR